MHVFKMHKKTHLVAVKRVFQYLIHTTNFGLWYSKGESFDLVLTQIWQETKVDRKSASEAS
jgi:hypothetical protein